MIQIRLPPLLLLLQVLSTSLVLADESDHFYKPGDVVHLWVNKIGPYSNPQEAYEYYTLPYCHPKNEAHEEHRPEIDADAFNIKNVLTAGKRGEWSIGEVLGGHKLRGSGYSIFFPKEGKSETVTEKECTKELSAKEAALFEKAVLERYFYQLYLDDLPVWGMVGELVDPKSGEIMSEYSENHQAHIYTHRTLVINYDGDSGRIITVDLISAKDSLVPIKPNTKVSFELDVQWQPNTSDLTYDTRFVRYLDSAFFAHTIHWFSLLNSGMMVLFLLGILSFILLRTLRRDILKAGMAADGIDDIEGEGASLLASEEEQSGWKILSTEVFRVPSFLPLLSALLGSGTQVLTTMIGVVVFCVLGPLHGNVYESRDELLSTMIYLFTLCTIAAGYVSGRTFKIWGGKHKYWQMTMVLTLVMLPMFFTAVFGILNTLSLWHGTIYTIPIWTILKLAALYGCISLPLGVFGTMLGRASVSSKGHHFPTRTNTLARPLPENLPFFATWKLSLVSGLFPFGSIFIELYYVLTSIWNYKFYHVYHFMFAVGLILLTVTSLTAVLGTYLLLQYENHYWQWHAFLGGATTGLYIYLYSTYYFLFKTSMYGILQTTYYFSYTAVLSCCFGVMCGAVAFFSASIFVKTIFRNVKVD
mmetsp:Transcript_25550/g.38139  ORF Transcript_25550/g.38139 Transcript_25550/m.38139 type:complete len:643 (-) Transcript_25550:214-2142(-)